MKEEEFEKEREGGEMGIYALWVGGDGTGEGARNRQCKTEKEGDRRDTKRRV